MTKTNANCRWHSICIIPFCLWISGCTWLQMADCILADCRYSCSSGSWFCIKTYRANHIFFFLLPGWLKKKKDSFSCFPQLQEKVFTARFILDLWMICSTLCWSSIRRTYSNVSKFLDSVEYQTVAIKGSKHSSSYSHIDTSLGNDWFKTLNCSSHAAGSLTAESRWNNDSLAS